MFLADSPGLIYSWWQNCKSVFDLLRYHSETQRWQKTGYGGLQVKAFSTTGGRKALRQTQRNNWDTSEDSLINSSYLLFSLTLVPSYKRWDIKSSNFWNLKTNEQLQVFLLFSFFPSQTIFHVINRHTGKAVSTRFYGDSMVVFHHINSYEADDHVVFDLISYKNSNLYDMFYIQNMKQETGNFIESNKNFSPPVCQRFVLPLNVHRVQTDCKTHRFPLVRCTQCVCNEFGVVYVPGISQRI